MTSIHMSRLCDSLMCPPAEIIFKFYSERVGVEHMLLQYTQKCSKIRKSYRPVSLNPMCGEIFQKLTECSNILC